MHNNAVNDRLLVSPKTGNTAMRFAAAFMMRIAYDVINVRTFQGLWNLAVQIAVKPVCPGRFFSRPCAG